MTRKHPLDGFDPEECLSTVEQLLALLDGPSKWCRRSSARDHSRCPCDPNSPYAESWCIYGAIARGCRHNWSRGQNAVTMLTRVAFQRGYLSLAAFNDSEDYWEIRGALLKLRDECTIAVSRFVPVEPVPSHHDALL